MARFLAWLAFTAAAISTIGAGVGYAGSTWETFDPVSEVPVWLFISVLWSCWYHNKD